MVLKNSSSPSIAIIISDMSIKNNVATSITHIYTSDKPLIKTIYHAVHVTSTEVELFTIRCGINQSLSVNNISKIVVITDFIHAVKNIFDPFVHPYQILWQPLITKTNDHTSSKSLKLDIKWEVYKRTQ